MMVFTLLFIKIRFYTTLSNFHTLFHELGHQLTITILKLAGHITKDYAKNEILAELVAYLLLKKLQNKDNQK
jgi:antirestriction protein ArdC